MFEEKHPLDGTRYTRCGYREVYLCGMPVNLVRAARGAVLLAIRGSGSVAADVFRRRPFRRARLVVIAGALAVGVFLLVIAAAAQFPIVVADGAVAWLFGGRENHVGAQIPQACAAPPPVTAPAAPESREPDVDEPAGAGPAFGLDAEGRPTAEAMAVIDAIPVGASLDTAQGWVLFRLAHPADPVAADFASFAEAFTETGRHLSAAATPLDVVASMDPGADYAPYLLLAQANGYRLMRQESVIYSPNQREDLIAALGVTCEDRAGVGRRQP